MAPKGIFNLVFKNSGFCFIFSLYFIICSSVFKQTGGQRVGLDGRLRPGQYLPEQNGIGSSQESSPPSTRPPTAFPCPGNSGMGGRSANQCHRIKSSAVRCVGRLWEAAVAARPMGPRRGTWLRLHPLELSWGHHPLEPSCQFQDDSRSWPHGRLMPAPFSG